MARQSHEEQGQIRRGAAAEAEEAERQVKEEAERTRLETEAAAKAAEVAPKAAESGRPMAAPPSDLGSEEEDNSSIRKRVLRIIKSRCQAYHQKCEEGNLGLLRAVEGFDPEMGTRFSTYASYWIKQSIKRALVNSAKTIRIPAYMVELLSKWRRATANRASYVKNACSWPSLHAIRTA